MSNRARFSSFSKYFRQETEAVVNASTRASFPAQVLPNNPSNNNGRTCCIYGIRFCSKIDKKIFIIYTVDIQTTGKK